MAITTYTQVDNAAQFANWQGTDPHRSGIYCGDNNSTHKCNVSWKEGGWTADNTGQNSICLYGWCGTGNPNLDQGNCDLGAETDLGYLMGACNSSAWGQRFGGYIKQGSLLTGYDEAYKYGVTGTTTYGYHPFWLLDYNGEWRDYQGWSYGSHAADYVPTYRVESPGSCGNGVCDWADSCSNCSADCGTCLTATTGNVVNKQYTYTAPQGNPTINVFGGTGDADLYVKLGSQPTTTSFDCRSYRVGNWEQCKMTQGSGTYYVMVRAYSTFAGVTVKAKGVCIPQCAQRCGQADGCGGTCSNADASSCGMCGNPACPQIYLTGLSGAKSALTQRGTVTGNNVNAHTYGGTGDMDLYVKFGSAPTTSSYTCKSNATGNVENCYGASGSGTYYVATYGYSAYTGASLSAYPTATFSPLSGASGAMAIYTMTNVCNPKITTSGGTGDLDLYVKLGSAPTTSSYSCRSNATGNAETCTLTTGCGTYYIGLYGYTAYAGATLTEQ